MNSERKELTGEEKLMAGIEAIESLMEDAVQGFKNAGIVNVRTVEQRDDYIAKMLWARDELDRAYKKRVSGSQ